MRLLVVEDEVRLAESLKAGLEAEGYAVDLAFTGPDGLWMASEHTYAAIVLDILLPGLNGYRVCARLRAAGNATPILMLTAKDGELDEAEALDTGADDFLSKPFSYVVFLARLRALIRRGGSTRPSVLRVGDVELDLGRRECRSGGVPVPLSVKEFSVLSFLLSRPGEVVSKAEVLDGLWDFASTPDPNLVEVYVSSLRRKLGRDVIRTVRGAGYVVGRG
ncbi:MULTISPECIES: response regulator transcription factor [Saccharothrix]|uniref:response regulator transcription factor n=1 Tax=Saccharothrix TaxID=2071 RepID=UPI00093FC17A|nr:response regulator transcription factor [Saccharothrix sp. CB00851]OKI36278.1 DNA-binding response regulator [Saccharothrix sp. CB00851]